MVVCRAATRRATMGSALSRHEAEVARRRARQRVLDSHVEAAAKRLERVRAEAAATDGAASAAVTAATEALAAARRIATSYTTETTLVMQQHEHEMRTEQFSSEAAAIDKQMGGMNGRRAAMMDELVLDAKREKLRREEERFQRIKADLRSAHQREAASLADADGDAGGGGGGGDGGGGRGQEDDGGGEIPFPAVPTHPVRIRVAAHVAERMR